MDEFSALMVHSCLNSATGWGPNLHLPQGPFWEIPHIQTTTTAFGVFWIIRVRTDNFIQIEG
jgi:hypothetical protein